MNCSHLCSHSILSCPPMGHASLPHHHSFWTCGAGRWLVIGQLRSCLSSPSLLLLSLPQDGLCHSGLPQPSEALPQPPFSGLERRGDGSTMCRKEGSKVLWKAMLSLRSCTLVSISRGSSLLQDALSGLRHSLRIPLLSVDTLVCRGQRLAGAHL